MPIELYSYKPGCRSTPKLRRNQSGWKYKNNPSIDSFTSLRPESPGLLQNLPGSPLSIGTGNSWPLSPRSAFQSPRTPSFAAAASPCAPIDSIMSPLEPITLSQMEAFDPSYEFAGDPNTPELNPESPGKTERAEPKEWLQKVFTVPTEESDYDKPANGDQNAMTADVKHVLGLNLHPHQVALIRDARHESGIVRIYDRKGNEISYKFGGGMEQFRQEYKLDEPFEPGKRRESGPWKRLQNLGRKVKKGIRSKVQGTRLYEVETWSRRLDR